MNKNPNTLYTSKKKCSCCATRREQNIRTLRTLNKEREREREIRVLCTGGLTPPEKVFFCSSVLSTEEKCEEHDFLLQEKCSIREQQEANK